MSAPSHINRSFVPLQASMASYRVSSHSFCAIRFNPLLNREVAYELSGISSWRMFIVCLYNKVIAVAVGLDIDKFKIVS